MAGMLRWLESPEAPPPAPIALGARTAKLLRLLASLSTGPRKLGRGKRRRRWDRGALFLNILSTTSGGVLRFVLAAHDA